jgi:cell wall-associated NlpC family hydrolase
VRHQAPAPGERDLARHDLWELSLERSLRRRAAGPPAGPLRRQGARGAALLAAATLSTTPIALANTRSTVAELHVGSHGAAVRALQRALGVEVDGVFGPQTRAAVSEFEREQGLPIDGRLDPVVLQRLSVASTAAPGAAPAQPSAAAAGAVAAARSKIGSPYRSGATGPSAFDCSGLVVWAMGKAGISVPRTSFDQYRAGTAITRSQIQAGDLVFFNTAGPGASDVGIATSATSAVSATTHGVREHAIFDSYWGSHFVGARRLTG